MLSTLLNIYVSSICWIRWIEGTMGKDSGTKVLNGKVEGGNRGERRARVNPKEGAVATRAEMPFSPPKNW